MKRPVYLPLQEPRCRPVSPCPQSSRCGRALVAADIGRPLADLSNSYGWIAGRCLHYRDAALCVKPADPEKPAHECPGGLL